MEKNINIFSIEFNGIGVKYSFHKEKFEKLKKNLQEVDAVSYFYQQD